MSAEPKSVSELLADIERMRRALQPFAAVACIYATRPPDTRLVSTAMGSVAVGDFRRAATALG